MKKATTILLGIGSVLLLTGIAFAFLVAPIAVDPNTGKEVFHQKILYIHVPVAETSLVSFILAAIFGALFLYKRERKYDFLSFAAVELGFLYGFLVEMTGIMWDKAAWGVWWQWEPRLTTYLILMLMYAGYFVMRSSIGEDSSKARFSAVYSIIAAVNVPLTFFAIRLIPAAAHPVVFDSSGSGLHGSLLVAFLVSMFGMTCFYISLLLTRYQMHGMGEELDILKNQIGG